MKNHELSISLSIEAKELIRCAKRLYEKAAKLEESTLREAHDSDAEINETISSLFRSTVVLYAKAGWKGKAKELFKESKNYEMRPSDIQEMKIATSKDYAPY